MSNLAYLDFETYSEAGFLPTSEGWACLPGASGNKKGLPVVGAAAYVEHPTFEVLTASYDLGDGIIHRWQPGNGVPLDLFAHTMRGGLLSGWNSGGFEAKVWKRLGWPPIAPTQWRDTMASARAYSLPGSMDKAAEVAGIAQQKDKDGKRLLDKFSIPRKPTIKDPRRRILLSEDLEDAERLFQYCDQDVRTEKNMAAIIPPLSDSELAIWQCDRGINDRGVSTDTQGVSACISIIEQAHELYNSELPQLTNGSVTKASEIQRITEWMASRKVFTDSLDEDHLIELLTRDDLPTDVRRVLEIRAAIGSASVKKVFAMRNQMTLDGRLHDLFMYHGARTGRTIGAGPQPTNLPNSAGVFAMECEGCKKHFGLHTDFCPFCGCMAAVSEKVEWGVLSAEQALEAISTHSLEYVELVWGDAMQAVSGSLRALFTAAPGKDLICSDYSSIEAVVIAELAGEQWRKDVFRTHGKIYEMSAALVTGVTLEEMLAHKERTGSHHTHRKLGKVMELACGYGGWTGSMKAFGADEFMTEQEMKDAVIAWRKTSPAIVEMWGGQQKNYRTEYFGIEGVAILSILNPGSEFWSHGMRLQVRDDVMFLRLLSGREIAYHRPRLRPSERREGTYAISYEGWNSNPKNGATGWIRMDTYGPRLVENIVQATARDIQWFGVLALEKAGYPIVLHVYDEDVAEVDEGWGSIEEFERIMSTMPAWAMGWPVRAKGGWRGKRYRK